MSNIYIQEPPTCGKVLLITTVGEIDIELWAKETPKACRNFVQLSMEGYYNDTTFHRIVKGFIAQGGDPTGTGNGGESIYGQPFKDEFHSRLRFCRRGLVAMANSAKDDNGSQFFFTFAACPELQNKHTIFGKVTGETIYNMLKLEEAVTENETPLYPQKIIRVKILNNPFPDIVPRCLPESKTKVQKSEKKSVAKAGVKDFKLLSFGEEAEEDEEESTEISLSLASRSKSTHDLLNDPKLSSVPVIKQDEYFSGNDSSEKKLTEKKLRAEDVQQMLKRKKSKTDEEKEKSKKRLNFDRGEEYDFGKAEIERKKMRLQEIAKEIEAVKRDYRRNAKSKEKKKEVEEVPTEESTVKEEKNEYVKEYKSNIEKYKNLKSGMAKKGKERESMTLELLANFKKRLQAVKENDEEESVGETRNVEDADDDKTWLAHKLNFEGTTPVLAKDANLRSDDWFDITDPRNPINKRRREKKKTENKKT